MSVLLIWNRRYVWFQMRTHHGIYDAVLAKDEEKDHDRERDLRKSKLTLTECFLALVIALTCVSLHAVFLGKCSPFKIVMDCKGYTRLPTMNHSGADRSHRGRGTR